MKRRLMTAVGLSALLGAGLAQAVNYYDGTGDVSSGVNWSDGTNSVPPALGLITNAVDATTGNQWDHIGVRQTGGSLHDAADGGLAQPDGNQLGD